MNAKHIFHYLILATMLSTTACSSKKENNTEGTGQDDQREWKEMDEFHLVMAEAFHPYKDSSNLEPAKSHASELVASADKWSSAAMPKKVANDEMKSKLQQLKSEAQAFADVVQAGDDKVIGDQLTKLHDLFHEIQEMWYGGHGDHKHKH
jgi:hypothetical protein